MKLDDRVCLVGSGDAAGFSLTHPLDCHVYLLDGKDEAALFESGAGQDVEAIIRRIRQSGCPLEKVRWLFLTHSHFDHAGGAMRLKERLNLKVAASEGTAAILQAGDMEKNGMAPLQRAGLYPAGLRLEPCPVDLVLADGDEVQVGDLAVRALSTPGHSADHTAFYVDAGSRKMLFSGDALFAGGRVILQNLPDVDLQACIRTSRRLITFELDMLLPAHGMPITNRAGRSLTALRERLDSFGIPGNLIIE